MIEAVAGETIHLTGSAVTVTSTNPAAYSGFNQLTLVFEGGASHVDPLEIASQDLGAALTALTNNFALYELILGGRNAGNVRLSDAFDNSPGADVLYVNTLTVGAASTLDLNGRKLYYRQLSLAPSGTIVPNGGALIRVVAEPSTHATAVLLSIAGVHATTVLTHRRRFSRCATST